MIIPPTPIVVSWGDNSVKINETNPIAIPNQISTISMHISFGENSSIFTQVIVWIRKYGCVCRWQITLIKNWRNLPISYPKPDLYNINAHPKFGEKPLIFTQVIVWKQKYWRVTGRQLYQNLTKFAHSLCTYQVWWKSIQIYPSYHLEMKNQLCCGQIIVKNWRNLPISNPKPVPQYQCTHQVWRKYTDIYSSYHLQTKLQTNIIRQMDKWTGWNSKKMGVMWLVWTNNGYVTFFLMWPVTLKKKSHNHYLKIVSYNTRLDELNHPVESCVTVSHINVWTADK